MLATCTAEWIIGSDEAGYGALAGDLVVAAVAVRRTWTEPDVRDSKLISDATRRSLVRRYRAHPEVHWVVDATSPASIDRNGVWALLIESHNHVHEALAAKLEAVDQGGSTLHVADGLENAHARLL